MVTPGTGIAVAPGVSKEPCQLMGLTPRVVVLGGESSSRAGLTDLLTDDGFEVVSCEDMTSALFELSAQGALVVEQTTPPDRLASFLREAVEVSGNAPVFVITPYGDTELHLNEHGVTPRECFPMPLVYDELVAALRECGADSGAASPASSLGLTAELISEMDRPGPRYTSYPTAPVLDDGFSNCLYEKALSTAGTGPLSLYVHIPFCPSMCAYCACNVVVRKDARRAGAPYVRRVLAEARMVSEKLHAGRRVTELHLGGGTPNYLSRQHIEQLMEGLRARFDVAESLDASIEVDPRHYEADQLDWLASLGFNRVSLGLQDVDECVQQAIGRLQSLEQTAATFEAAKAAGFESVNIDLVYGLPGQTRRSFAATVRAVIELRPERIAMFSFAYVPAHKPSQRKLDVSRAPAGPEKAQLFLDAVEALTEAGYAQVGMDHFALPKDDLARSQRDGTLHRNFQGYVPGPAMDLVGLGVTSISDVAGVLAQNHRSLKDWEAAVDGGVLPVARGWKRGFDDEVRRAVIQRLMCRFELSFDELASSFGIDHDRYFEAVLPKLSALADQGLVRREGAGLTVTALGRFFVRNIAMLYDAYLPSLSKSFSRTV